MRFLFDFFKQLILNFLDNEPVFVPTIYEVAGEDVVCLPLGTFLTEKKLLNGNLKVSG